MIKISEGVYIEEDQIEVSYDDMIIMKDGVLVYVDDKITKISEMS